MSMPTMPRDKLTWQSRTGLFIFLNSAPINWYSKHQSTIHWVFCFWIRGCCYKNQDGEIAWPALQYKLRSHDGNPTGLPDLYTSGDNMSVIFNTSCPESTLRKKSNCICYHAIHESVLAMGGMVTAHYEPSITPTQLLISRQKSSQADNAMTPLSAVSSTI
jgi:hypothetical protein